MNEKTEKVYDYRYFMKPLPRASRKNFLDCWNILKNYCFNRGALYSLGVIVSHSPSFKGWRIAFESTENKNFPSTGPQFPGFVPYPKHVYVKDLRDYLTNILPNNYRPSNIAICKFPDRYGKYRLTWVVDLKPADISKVIGYHDDEHILKVMGSDKAQISNSNCNAKRIGGLKRKDPKTKKCTNDTKRRKT